MAAVRNPPLSMRPFALQQTRTLLRRLAYQVSRASRPGGADVVDDLRVAVGRFSRCLRLFAQFLPGGKSKRVRRELKEVMDLAAAVRDCDKALELLREARIPARSKLTVTLSRECQEAETRLRAGLRRLGRQKLLAKMARRAQALNMAKTIRWDEAATAAQNVRRKLPPLVKEYFAEGRAVVRAKPSRAAIHRFTLRTRRLIYTLELFQSCYGPGLAQRLDALRRVERLLEEFDDCAAARGIFGKVSQIGLRHFLDDRARRKLAEFRACWTAEVDARGQEQAWREYLARARSR